MKRLLSQIPVADEIMNQQPQQVESNSMLMTSRSEIQRTSILPYQGLNLLEKLNNLNLEIFMKVSDQKEKKDKMKIVDEILSSIKAFNKT